MSDGPAPDFVAPPRTADAACHDRQLGQARTRARAPMAQRGN